MKKYACGTCGKMEYFLCDMQWCKNCYAKMLKKREADFEVSKENIMAIFEKFRENSRLWESTFIPDEKEFKEISAYFEKNLEPSKWYSYLLGSNKYKRSIMFTVEQATYLIKHVQKYYDTKSKEYYNIICRYCWALDSFILLVKSMGEVHGFYEHYHCHVVTEESIIDNWNDKFNGHSKGFLKPIKIDECILCDKEITQCHVFTICLHCDKKFHYECNVEYHLRMIHNSKPPACKNCGDPNIKLDEDMVLCNKKIYKKINPKISHKLKQFEWIDYLKLD